MYIYDITLLLQQQKIIYFITISSGNNKNIECRTATLSQDQKQIMSNRSNWLVRATEGRMIEFILAGWWINRSPTKKEEMTKSNVFVLILFIHLSTASLENVQRKEHSRSHHSSILSSEPSPAVSSGPNVDVLRIFFSLYSSHVFVLFVESFQLWKFRKQR